MNTFGWMKFCNDMNQKRCASKNLLTRNFTKTQKSEKRKIKIPPTMIRTSFFNTNYEGVHIENRKRKAKPKSQIPPTINSVTDSRYRITSAPLSAATFAFHVSEFEIRLSNGTRPHFSKKDSAAATCTCSVRRGACGVGLEAVANDP